MVGNCARSVLARFVVALKNQSSVFLLNKMQDIECQGGGGGRSLKVSCIKYIQSINEMDHLCNNVFRCEKNINFKIFVKRTLYQICILTNMHVVKITSGTDEYFSWFVLEVSQVPVGLTFEEKRDE